MWRVVKSYWVRSLFFFIACVSQVSCLQNDKPSIVENPNLIYHATEIGNAGKLVTFVPNQIIVDPFLGQSTYVLISNPFDEPGRTVADMFQNFPTGSAIIRVFNGLPIINKLITHSDGTRSWESPEDIIPYGEAFWLRLSSNEISADVYNFSISGAIPQGDFSVPLPKSGELGLIGYKGSSAGRLTSDLNLPATDGTKVWLIEPYGYTQYEHNGIEWMPKEPSLQPGQAFWMTAGGAGSWIQRNPEVVSKEIFWSIRINRGDYNNVITINYLNGDRVITSDQAEVHLFAFDTLESGGLARVERAGVGTISYPPYHPITHDGSRWWRITFDTDIQKTMYPGHYAAVRESDIKRYEDKTPPETPVLLSATRISSEQVQLTWSPPHDPTNPDTGWLSTVKIYLLKKVTHPDVRGGFFVFATLNGRSTETIDVKATDIATHSYMIRLVDFSGNASGDSNILSVEAAQ